MGVLVIDCKGVPPSNTQMIKAKFGDGLFGKTPEAQTNEILAKVVCHNLCVLIQSFYELNIDPVFNTGAPEAAVA